MTDAFVAILVCTLSFVAGYLFMRRLHGEKRWQDGYLQGFSAAWDEKAKTEKEVVERRMKELRKRRPNFQVIKGEKS